MTKKYGGKLGGWQIHKLKYTDSQLRALKLLYPDAITDPAPMVITGIVKEDPTGRWGDGSHFRSSLIVKLDRVENRIETCNTFYDFDPEDEGKDPYLNKDIGNLAINIFY